MRLFRSELSTAVTGMVMSVVLTGVALAQAPVVNPLSVGPMPRCGPMDASFERLFEDLKLRRSWRGSHENRSGELVLAEGPGGAWYLFYRALDRQDRAHICLIARGRHSKALFGSPV